MSGSAAVRMAANNLDTLNARLRTRGDRSAVINDISLSESGNTAAKGRSRNRPTRSRGVHQQRM
jgi:hypothetical protein